MRRDLPSGTVTFLFTDIEGSTKLLHELGPEVYAQALMEHRRILREAFARHGGVEVDSQGDAFFIAFPTASGAVDAAAQAQESLAEGPIRVRMGIDTGAPHLTDEGYVGEVVHKGARIASAGHGGQVLLSKETRELVDVGVTDLGEHRLKDFSMPVAILQLGLERFPPLKTISNTNLPRPASSFVGREKEVAEVVGMLGNGVRLLTLTGPGGSGKTRLGIEAAAELVPAFKAGVFWVPLAPLRDPALVAATIGQTLGAEGGLAEHVGEREMLLLLDNLEQVIEAAPELASVVEACPNLRILVTSRELLRVRGEVEYPVLPLAEPEAVELFRARSGLGADDTIAELCRRLDSLPLAIELAAARTSVLTPAQILERLSKRLDLLRGRRDAEARQQTLRATIEWSHDLLDEDEQGLFARLAVFRGGCTLEAAEEVAEADLDTLQSLVDKSLIRHRDDRFWMLETIREFAVERLEGSGEAEDMRRGHAEHFLALAEEAEPHLDRDSVEWLDRLERDLDNVRAAFDRLEATGEAQLVLRLAGATRRFWYLRGYLAEGQRRVERALAADPRPTAARAKALLGASAGAVNTSRDFARARAWAEEALEIHRTLGDGWGVANSRFLLGFADVEEGDFEGAVAPLEESLRLFDELGDENRVSVVAFNLIWAYNELGERQRARALAEDNLRRARGTGNERNISFALDSLETYAREEGRLAEALSMNKEILRIRWRAGDRLHVTDSLGRFAAVLSALQSPRPAVQLLARSVSSFEELGISMPAYWESRNEETLTALRGKLDEATFTEAWDEGRKMTIDEAVALALDQVG